MGQRRQVTFRAAGATVFEFESEAEGAGRFARGQAQIDTRQIAIPGDDYGPQILRKQIAAVLVQRGWEVIEAGTESAQDGANGVRVSDDPATHAGIFCLDAVKPGQPPKNDGIAVAQEPA